MARREDEYGHYQEDQNKNLIAYQRLTADPAWVAEKKGKYVAFVSGELIGEYTDEPSMLSDIKKRFPDTGVLFQLVGDERVLHVPSILGFTEVEKTEANISSLAEALKSILRPEFVAALMACDSFEDALKLGVMLLTLEGVEDPDAVLIEKGVLL